MKHHWLFLRTLITVCALSSSLFGCALTGTFDGLQNAHGKTVYEPDVIEAFKRGDLRLTCRMPCASTQGWNRSKMKSLHYDHSWEELALLVAKVGNETDLNYYYLGRSAEGEGYIEAAKVYYRLALEKKLPKCAGFTNNCDGFVFPKDIQARLDRMKSDILR